MAKSDKKKPKFDWQGYVNIDVPERKHTDLEQYVADDKQVFFCYNSLLTTDYQFKQYFDSYTQAIKTVVTCYNADSENFGYAMTAYAEDWYTSLAVAIYKHMVLADGIWSSAASNKVKRFG